MIILFMYANKDLVDEKKKRKNGTYIEGTGGTSLIPVCVAQCVSW